MRGPARAESALLRVRVQPRASRDEVTGWDGLTLRVSVSAAPVDGAANDAVRALLARSFRVPPSAITLVRGAHARDKLVRIEGLSPEVLEARIAAGFP
jgi:hypothetical protein